MMAYFVQNQPEFPELIMVRSGHFVQKSGAQWPLLRLLNGEHVKT